MAYKGRHIYTIQPSDVGKGQILISACECCDYKKRILTRDFMGTIQPQDVGKQIYNTAKGTPQVESQEQLNIRTGGDK